MKLREFNLRKDQRSRMTLMYVVFPSMFVPPLLPPESRWMRCFHFLSTSLLFYLPYRTSYSRLLR